MKMKQILIVDDFEPARIILRERLEIQGYLCHEVENGAEALKAIQTKPFDLVITDNHMPVMTGLQMLQCLAERPDDQQPPVIMITGHASNELSSFAQAAGACAVLEKPFNAQKLISEITRILELR
jgi:CheY-like chemotaxis protein